MEVDLTDKVDEHHAAVLQGFSIPELRRLSRLAGVGRWENREGNEQLLFTYEELCRLSLSAAQASD